MVGAKDDGLPGQTFPPLRWRAFGDVHGPKRMTVRASIRTGDLNRLLKAARANGFALERRPDGTLRFLPFDGEPLTATPDVAPPSDPLDAELAEWAAKHGYD